MNKQKVKSDVVEVADLPLNFDLILEHARVNSYRVYELISSIYKLKFLQNELKHDKSVVELKTEPTNYGATRLEELADTVEIDLNNDIRTLVGVNDKKINPIFFSVNSLIEIGSNFNLNFFSTKDNSIIISEIGSPVKSKK